MSMQTILKAGTTYEELEQYLAANVSKGIFLVCGQSICSLPINTYFRNLTERTNIKLVRFSGFAPNPTYESVVDGVQQFREAGCDMILAVGGGSAMDVAKCIKLYANMDPQKNYLEQNIRPNGIKLLAVPTTAGTGSEATQYAVIYYQGKKQSVSHASCIPEAVLFDASALKTLPAYQRKTTMLDALCHGIESFWSVHSTHESKQYSKQAIQMILSNMESYLANEMQGNEGMLYAANTAGKAISITQTTAGHAMCYSLTSLYHLSHGHAAALCLAELWPFMIAHPERCIDPRGVEYLQKVFQEIAWAMGCDTPSQAVNKYHDILNQLNLQVPQPKEQDYIMLKKSVNPVRLKNHPIQLDENTINYLYHQILS